MNKMKLALLVAGSLVAGASTSAFAEGQGTVTFTGKLITETCEIVGDKDQTVALDAVSIKTLDASGKEGGFKAFNITVKCPDQANPAEFNEVGIHFEPVGSTTPWDPATGNLKNNTQGGAENVQIKIYNTNDGVQSHAKIGDVSKWLPGSTGEHTFNYAGGYYASGATTAGDVSAKVMYTLVYK